MNEIKEALVTEVDTEYAFNSREIGQDDKGNWTESPVDDFLRDQQPLVVSEDGKKEEGSVNQIARLVESIKEHKQLTPCLVRMHPKPTKEKKYQLIAGFRRMTALRILGWKTVVVQILTVSDKEAAYLNLIENEDRKQLSTYEIAKSAKAIKDAFKEPSAEIAKRLRKSPSYIHNLILNMEDLDPRIVQAWKDKNSACAVDKLNKLRGYPRESMDPTKPSQIEAFEAMKGVKKKGSNGNGPVVPGAPVVTTGPRTPKVRTMRELEACKEYFGSGDFDIDAEVLDAYVAMLDWAMGVSDKVSDEYDIGEYVKAKTEEAKNKSEAFKTFLSSTTGQEAMRKQFEAFQASQATAAPKK